MLHICKFKSCVCICSIYLSRTLAILKLNSELEPECSTPLRGILDLATKCDVSELLISVLPVWSSCFE